MRKNKPFLHSVAHWDCEYCFNVDQKTTFYDYGLTIFAYGSSGPEIELKKNRLEWDLSTESKYTVTYQYPLGFSCIFKYGKMKIFNQLSYAHVFRSKWAWVFFDPLFPLFYSTATCFSQGRELAVIRIRSITMTSR